jgi:hypothetical protein
MAVLCVRCEFQINHAYVGICDGKLRLGQGFISPAFAASSIPVGI